MKIFQQLALCLFASGISSYTYADIIELDAINPDHCRQQILKSADNLPVIATYIDGGKDSESFMKKFDILAKEHPERTFFKWNAKKDVLHATQTLCLQQLGFSLHPSIRLLAVVRDENTEKSIMSAPLRLYWAGEMTLTEMTMFIDIPDSDVKNLFSRKQIALN